MVTDMTLRSRDENIFILWHFLDVAVTLNIKYRW